MGKGLLRMFETKEKERVVCLSAANVNNIALKTFTIMLPTISASINGIQIFLSSPHFNYSCLPIRIKHLFFTSQRLSCASNVVMSFTLKITIIN